MRARRMAATAKKKEAPSLEPLIREVRDALDAGDVAIVDEAESFEMVSVLGKGSFGTAELRRVPGSDGASEGSFVVLKRVVLKRGVPAKLLVGEVMNGAAMRHRHIVRTYGAYLSASPDTLVLAMEYMAGGTLEERIGFQRKCGPFSGALVTTWLSQLCSAVEYMHSRRVLHRDIGTANLFLSAESRVLLGDLGLSRELDAEKTKVKTQMGTPPYMSPERVEGKAYGAGCDVWAVGVVLYELLALMK